MEVNMKLEQDHMEGVDEREWVSSLSKCSYKGELFNG